MRLKTFPKLIFEKRGRKEPLSLHMQHQLHPYLMAKTALHQETLARLGLLKPLVDYTDGTQSVTESLSLARQKIKVAKPGGSSAAAQLLMNSRMQLADPCEALAQSAESSMNGLEFFSLIRQPQSPDVFAEYTNYEQLRRMRQAYIVHILDQVLAERSVVSWNDKEIQEEEDKEQGTRITLDNVFEIEKENQKEEGKADESDNDAEEGDDRAGMAMTEVIDDSEMVRSTQQQAYQASESR